MMYQNGIRYETDSQGITRRVSDPGYVTKPLVVSTLSGFLPEEDRVLRGIYSLKPKDAREERVVVPTREVVCYECGMSSRIPVAALSAHCVHCRAHLNTVDVVLKPGSRRHTIRTLGDVTLPANVTISHLSIICRHLIVCGKGSGSIHCTGTLTMRGAARLEGQVQAGALHVPLGAQAEFAPGASAEEARIEGELTAKLHIKGTLHLCRSGVLRGDCLAGRLVQDPGARLIGSWRSTDGDF